jgi:hypothetical protein
MRLIGIRNLFCMSAGLAILIALAGCSGKSTPPGASFVYGQVDVPEGFGGSFTAWRWNEGLTILLLDDIEAGHESSGAGSTESPIWRGQGGAVAADGRQVSWRAETTDGKTASFSIDGHAYDLAQGTLFLIRARGGRMSVLQQKRDLAGRCTDSEDCQLWLKSDPTAAQFIQEVINSRMRQSDQGISDSQAAELTPESSIAYSSRCRANYQQGKFDQAIADCSRAIELDPKAAEAYLHRGLAFKDKGQTPEAVRDFESFLQLSDNPMDRMQVERLMNKIR